MLTPRAALAKGAVLLLGASGKGTRTLVVGADAEAIGEVASYFGSEAVVTRAGDLQRCADASADTIVLHRVLGDAQTTRALVDQCARILKPRGRVILVTENPISLTNLYATARRPWQFARTLGSWQVHRRTRAQLEVAQTYIISPTINRWKVLAPAQHGLPRTAHASLKGRVENALLGLLRALRVDTALAPGYVITASFSADPPNSSVIEQILAAEDLPTHAVRLMPQPNSRSVTFADGSLFFKIPLSADGESAAMTQVDSLAAVTGKPVAAFAPIPARRREAGGVRYVTFPNLPTSDRAPGRSDVITIMDALHAESTTASLSSTDFWARVSSPAVNEMLSVLKAGPLLGQLAHVSTSKRLPVGPVHGDLHFANVIVRGDQKFLLDWDRYEANSPLLLDYAEAFLSTDARGGPSADWRTRLTTLQRMLSTDDGDVGSIGNARGELTTAEAVAVYVLHRASWTLIRHGLTDDQQARMLEAQLAYCGELAGVANH